MKQDQSEKSAGCLKKRHLKISGPIRNPRPPHYRPERRKMLERKKSRRLIAIILVSSAAIVAAGVYLVNGSVSRKPREDYKTAKVLKRDLGATIQATGIVKPMIGSEVKVGCRLPGKVVELPINVGDKVSRGQVIARLEQDDLRAKVQLQEAILDEAKAELERLEKDYQRDKQLQETKSIADQKYDQTYSLKEMAKAREKKGQCGS